MASTLPVAGLWSREWEEDPLGCPSHNVDCTTLVWWLQTSESKIYIDIRLPVDKGTGKSVTEIASSIGIQKRPSALAANGYSQAAKECLLKYDDYNIFKSDNSLNKSDHRWLSSLCRIKSFAGVLQYELGDTTESKEAMKKDFKLAELANNNDDNNLPLCTCFWRRDIDYQPPTGNLDTGVCIGAASNTNTTNIVNDDSSDEDFDFMRETGSDGSYAELWKRPSKSKNGPFTVFVLVSENGILHARQGYWIWAGNYFAYAIGRPTSAQNAMDLQCCYESECVATSVGQTLHDFVESTCKDDLESSLDLLGTYVAVAGVVDVESSESWMIKYSTQPELLGCFLFDNGHDDHDVSCNKAFCSTVEEYSNDDGTLMIKQNISTSTDKPAVTRIWKCVERSSNCDLVI